MQCRAIENAERDEEKQRRGEEKARKNDSGIEASRQATTEKE